MEKAMATHYSTLAWWIPWMEEPGRLQSMGSLRVGYDWETSLSLFSFMHWRRKWQPTRVLAWRIPGTGSLVGCVYGVAQSRTRLNRLSSSSSPWLRCQHRVWAPVSMYDLFSPHPRHGCPVPSQLPAEIWCSPPVDATHPLLISNCSRSLWTEQKPRHCLPVPHRHTVSVRWFHTGPF